LPQSEKPGQGKNLVHLRERTAFLGENHDEKKPRRGEVSEYKMTPVSLFDN
jgi:hypothetical protein